jgi:hypothetical protein
MLPAFELAGAGDQRERQIRAKFDSARAAADLDNGIRVHQDLSRESFVRRAGGAI